MSLVQPHEPFKGREYSVINGRRASQRDLKTRGIWQVLALKMEKATGKDQKADHPTTSKKVGTLVLQPQELDSATTWMILDSCPEFSI